MSECKFKQQEYHKASTEKSSEDKTTELSSLYEDPSDRLNLFGFFETLLEIARDNPQIIQENHTDQSKVVPVKPKKRK